MTKIHTARVDFENNAEQFWDAFRKNLTLLTQSSELCRRCNELLADDVTTFKTELDYQSFRAYVSEFVGFDSGPAHAKFPIVFSELDDDEGEPQRQTYITINDDPDDWGAMPPGCDLDAEITKIINAADDAKIVVYHNCQPSQEVRDNGTEIDWFAEWCGVGHEWDEHDWTNWFRAQ